MIRNKTSALAPKAVPPKYLTKVHRALLTACIHLGTDDSHRLAAHLYLTTGTIEKYFSRIYLILGKSTRTEVILYYALREGLLILPEYT